MDLAVATHAETFERLREHLTDYGITARSIQPDSRRLPLVATDEFDGFDVGFVYPSRLMEGAVVAAHLDVPWVNGRDAVLTSRNKAGVLTRLKTAGLPVPDSIMVSNPTDESERQSAFEAIGPPLVVKPNSATRGVGVARADDLDSFLGLCDYLDLAHDFPATGDRSFLVQEYLPDARDYRAMVIDGEFVGAVERRLPSDLRDAGRWKHNVHRDATARSVDLDSALQTLAEDTAAALDIEFLGVDILVSGDRAVVNETNARPTIDDRGKYLPEFYDKLADLIEKTATRR